jgi:hypothetical protein
MRNGVRIRGPHNSVHLTRESVPPGGKIHIDLNFVSLNIGVIIIAPITRLRWPSPLKRLLYFAHELLRGNQQMHNTSFIPPR